MDANITQGDAAFRYAPSIDSFTFTPSPGVLDAINDAADSAFVADNNDAFVAAHRFVSHGNRDWLTDTEEFDASVGVKGRIEEDLGYDARISAYRLDGFVDGNTFVHLGSIQSEIEEGALRPCRPVLDRAGAPASHREQQLAGWRTISARNTWARGWRSRGRGSRSAASTRHGPQGWSWEAPRRTTSRTIAAVTA